MDESRKKPIMIAVILICLVAAGAVTYMTRSKGPGDVDTIPEGEKVWIKCNNPACKAEYQMSKKEYFKYLEEHIDPRSLTTPGIVCKKCGKKSAYRAEKCPKCGTIFFRGQKPGDFADRCPKCGFSATEEKRKKAKSGGGS